MPVTELDRANLIFERILYTPQQAQKENAAQEMPTAEQPSTPPKKNARSGQDLPDTRASSSTCKDSEARMTSDRPSVEARLKRYQAQLQSRKQSAPAKEKHRPQSRGAK